MRLLALFIIEGPRMGNITTESLWEKAYIKVCQIAFSKFESLILSPMLGGVCPLHQYIYFLA